MYDVIVVGGGNAACAAAVSAKENGAKRVVLLEKAPKEQRGGNTHFSGAILRFVFNEVEELDRFVRALETSRAPALASLEDGLAAQRLAEAAARSIREGRRIRLDG